MVGQAPTPSGPRLLVTGFEPFPGAPVNPTEWLVGRLREKPPRLPGVGAFRAELLPVDYRTVGARLEEIGRDFAPDIAVHFGLAQTAAGFRLERIARNRFESPRPDNSGYCPDDGPICAATPILPSTLPLEDIHAALTNAGLPVEWSDDAGGYLCNVVFTLSAAHAFDGFSPRMTGFVHVSPTGRGCALSRSQLARGAQIVMRTTVRAWSEAATAGKLRRRKRDDAPG